MFDPQQKVNVPCSVSNQNLVSCAPSRVVLLHRFGELLQHAEHRARRRADDTVRVLPLDQLPGARPMRILAEVPAVREVK